MTQRKKAPRKAPSKKPAAKTSARSTVNKKTDKKATRYKAIQPAMGTSFIESVFSGSKYDDAVPELVKNARDQEATSIRIRTDIDNGTVFECFDNGKGQGGKQRDAFLSLATSTRDGRSAQFGTGSKKFLFTFAQEVTVTTVPAEDPGTVCTFTCSVAKLPKILQSKKGIIPDTEEKTGKNWPFDSPTGTLLRYTLKDPQQSEILRGAELAEVLAARLPSRFRDIVTVDGQPLPVKTNIIGSIWKRDVEDPNLGPVSLELYRPKGRRRSDELLLGGGEVGETPIRELHRVAGMARERFPQTFLRSDVAGFIAVPYLEDYAVEQRNGFKPSIADDPRTVYLIQLLRDIEPDVKRALGLETSGEHVDGTEAISQVRNLLDATYGSEEVVISPPKKNGPDQDPDTEDDDSSGPRPIRLSHRGEYLPGELIEIILYRSEAVERAYPNAKVQWSVGSGPVHSAQATGRGISMVGSDVGQVRVTADLIGTPYKTSTIVTIVTTHRLRLKPTRVTVSQGAEVALNVVNSNALDGRTVYWDCTSKSKSALEYSGYQAIFRATHVETAVVSVQDSTDSTNIAKCEITVIPHRAVVSKIRNHRFVLKCFGAERSDAPPVAIFPGSDIHELFMNPLSPGYRAAEKSGNIRTFLALAVGMEYALFVMQEEDDGSMPIDQLVKLIQGESYEVATEILTGKPIAH